MNLKQYFSLKRGRLSALSAALGQPVSFIRQISRDERPCPSHLLDGIKDFTDGEVDVSTLRTIIRVNPKAPNE